MPTIKFWNPASDTEKLAQLKTQLKAVERELALGEDTGRDLVTQLSWEKDARKEAQKKYAGLHQEQLKLQQKHTCHVLATARAEQENADLQAKVHRLEQEIPNVQLDCDTNWADCRQTILSNDKLTQEAEALKTQLAAMQEARPMMAAQQTMRSPLRSLYGSRIGSVHTALRNISTAQAHAPAQASLKIRLKLPVGFQQRASRLSSEPAAAPTIGKPVKGSLVQARAEGTRSLANADKAADILSPATHTKGTPAQSPTAVSLPAVTSRTRSSGSETSPGTPSRVDTATPAKALGSTGSSKLQTKGTKKDAKKDLSLHGLRQMRTGFGIESLYAPGGMLAELDDTSSPTPLPAISEANLQAKVKDPHAEPFQELSVSEPGSNSQLAAQANAAAAADTSSSQTESVLAKSPIAVSLPALTSRTSNSGSRTSSATVSRVDTADEALGTTRSMSPKAADTQLQTTGQEPKKDRSLHGLRQMRTGFGIESLYAPGGMLAELTASSSPTPLPAIAKHAGPQAAAMTLPEQCSVTAEAATTTVQLSIAMAGHATGRTTLPGPDSATLGECLEDWCLSRGLCQDALTVFHFRKVVERKLWGHTFQQLAWGSEVHLQVKVKDPQVEPSHELSMPETGSNHQLAAQANAAEAADTSSSQTKSAPAKSPVAASLPALTSSTSNSGSKTSSATVSRVDIADEAFGTTTSVSPKAADTKLQTMGQGPKKDRSLHGLRQMRTGFGIESLYAPGGMLAELADTSPTPLPAIAKHAGPQAAAMTLPEQCSVADKAATTSVQLSIAMAGQATGRTNLPGPDSATLGECLEDWCLSRGLCQDALTVYHFRKVVDPKLWGQTFGQLAWGSEVHLQIKVQDGLTGTCQGAKTHKQLPLSCCTNQAHPQAVTSTCVSGPDPAEYQRQSTAAQSANGKPLSSLLKHSPTCSSGTMAKVPKPCTPLLVSTPQSALPVGKRSFAEPSATGSAQSSRSSHSMCEALPGTPTRADLVTPAKGMGGSHTSTSSQQGWSSHTSTTAGSTYPSSSSFAASQARSCKSTVGPSAELTPCLTRLAVPSVMDINSTGSLGLACIGTPATSAASKGSKTPAAAYKTTKVPSPAHIPLPAQGPTLETSQTLKHQILSTSSPACLVRPARKSSGISSISSRPEWSSAYSCTSALHPSPSPPCFPRQPRTPVSTAGTHTPTPAATATRPRRLSPTAAATPAVRSREAIRHPARRSSSLAARLASTARTGPLSTAQAHDHAAAATADEPSSTGQGATSPVVAAAPADPTYGSTVGSSRATASKPTRVQPAAKAAASSSVAAARKIAQPRRSGRQSSICTRPAPQTTAQPTADVNIATRPDSVQLRRSARQSSMLARPAVCPTAQPPAAQATAAASLRATAATAEPDSCQLRRSARQSSRPPRPSSTTASASANITAKPGNAQTACKSGQPLSYSFAYNSQDWSPKQASQAKQQID